MSIKLGLLSPIERFDSIERLTMEDQYSLLYQTSPLASITIDILYDKKQSYNHLVEHLLNIVAILHSIDLAAQNVLDYHDYAYILGDDTVSFLMEVSGCKQDEFEIIRLTETLSTLGSLYRFNVARKFGYPEREIMQLRLNGWGRLLFESRQLNESSIFKHAIEYCCDIFITHKHRYVDLFNLCNSTFRPLNTNMIHNINSNVPIPLVS